MVEIDGGLRSMMWSGVLGSGKWGYTLWGFCILPGFVVFSYFYDTVISRDPTIPFGM